MSMPNATPAPAPRARLDFGAVLSRTFGAYKANFVSFTLLMLLVLSPVVLWGLGVAFRFLGESASLDMADAMSSFGRWEILLSLFLQPVGTAAIVYGTFQYLKNGRSAPVGMCLKVGLARLLPVIGTGLLVGLAVLGGFLLLIIPGMIAAVALSVALPAAVVDRKGPFEALRYSAELTKGYRWPVFGVWFFLGLITNVLNHIVSRVTLDGASGSGMGTALAVFILLSLLITIMGGALQAAAASIIFRDLKVIKESVDTDELVRVFE